MNNGQQPHEIRVNVDQDRDRFRCVCGSENFIIEYKLCRILQVYVGVGPSRIRFEMDVCARCLRDAGETGNAFTRQEWAEKESKSES